MGVGGPRGVRRCVNDATAGMAGGSGEDVCPMAQTTLDCYKDCCDKDGVKASTSGSAPGAARARWAGWQHRAGRAQGARRQVVQFKASCPDMTDPCA